MKTLLFLFLLVATTTAFSQGKYINKNEYQKIMKSFEGETKASRGQVIVAMEEWMDSQKQFVMSKDLSDSPWRGEENEKYIINYTYNGARDKYNAFVLETYDSLRERAYFVKDTVLLSQHLYKGEQFVYRGNGRVESVDTTTITRKEFDLYFETYPLKNGKTFFKVFLKYHIWGTRDGEDKIGTAYLGKESKEIQDYIYKKVGK